MKGHTTTKKEDAMYCIVIYREHDADTSVNGPYTKREDALAARDAMAQRLAEGVENRVVKSLGESWDDEVIVYDDDYSETEPTDDDSHITLRVDGMSEPQVRCHNCGSIPNIRCCEMGRDR